MLRKIIRALLGKEEYELNVEVDIDIIDFIFILAVLGLLVWMLISIL